MPISNKQWRVEIGIFNATTRATYFKKKSLRVAAPVFCFFSFEFRFVFILLILFVCGDTELNPGPKNMKSCYNFSTCHWNLNSITAHNFAKVIHDLNMICLSESYLDSSVSSDNDNLYIKDHKLVRTDHPGNIKRDGMWVYFKESLPVSCLPNPYLKKCSIFEVSINNKRGYVFSMYRSPSQTSDDFYSFTSKLHKLVVNISNSNPHFTLMIGDFNAKSNNWSSNDTTTAESAQLDYLTSLYSMKQVITESTHILENSSSSIDLIFSNQPNLIADSAVHPTLHSECYHQIIYSKLNLKIEYPPPYTRKIWDYSRSETDLINRSIECFDWSKSFSGKNVHEQVELFNKILLNIFHNFIPNKTIVCGDRAPPWMNVYIKKMIKIKNWLFQSQGKAEN